jgi:ABC-type multidrug transport system fused ATPase/permease subunit
MIAHRLSTVRKCDQIYLLERGEVKASGNYAQLTKKSQHFASMAGDA